MNSHPTLAWISHESIIIMSLDFLDRKSHFEMMLACKAYYSCGNHYYRYLLLRDQIITQHEIDQYKKNLSCIPYEDNKDYLFLYKKLFVRDYLMFPISDFDNSYQNLQDIHITRKLFLTGHGIKSFLIGIKFATFYSYNNTLFITKSSDFYASNSGKLNKNIAIKEVQNVEYYSTEPNNILLYKDHEGRLFLVFYDEAQNICDMRVEVVPITLSLPAVQVAASFSYMIFTTERKLLISELGLQQEQLLYQEISCKEQKENIMFLNLKDLTPQEMEKEKLNVKLLEGMCGAIKEIACTSNRVVFLNEGGKLFISNFQNLKNFVNVFEVLSLSADLGIVQDKIIDHIFGGLSQFFALERERTESIEKWDCNQVIQWMQEKNFNDYTKIVKYNNINGQTLVNNATKEFLLNNLGMSRDDLQMKFLYEISEAKNVKFKPQKLYGLGRNSNGQLGFWTGIDNVSKLVKIPLPQLEEDDYVKDIEAAWKSSILITNNKRIFISEPLVKYQPKKTNEEFEEAKIPEEFLPKSNKRKEKKSQNPHKLPKRKDSGSTKQSSTTAPQNTISIVNPNATRWIEITKKFEILKDGRELEILKVKLTKNFIIGLGTVVRRGSLEIQKKHKTESLKEADKILDRIKWDSSLNQDDFVVGYEDRFVGTLELSVEDFLGSEVPRHRIRYFKNIKTSEIIWDKKQKMNKF